MTKEEIKVIKTVFKETYTKHKILENILGRVNYNKFIGPFDLITFKNIIRWSEGKIEAWFYISSEIESNNNFEIENKEIIKWFTKIKKVTLYLQEIETYVNNIFQIIKKAGQI